MPCQFHAFFIPGEGLVIYLEGEAAALARPLRRGLQLPGSVQEGLDGGFAAIDIPAAEGG